MARAEEGAAPSPGTCRPSAPGRPHRPSLHPALCPRALGRGLNAPGRREAPRPCRGGASHPAAGEGMGAHLCSARGPSAPRPDGEGQGRSPGRPGCRLPGFGVSEGGNAPPWAGTPWLEHQKRGGAPTGWGHGAGVPPGRGQGRGSPDGGHGRRHGAPPLLACDIGGGGALPESFPPPPLRLPEQVQREVLHCHWLPVTSPLRMNHQSELGPAPGALKAVAPALCNPGVGVPRRGQKKTLQT